MPSKSVPDSPSLEHKLAGRRLTSSKTDFTKVETIKPAIQKVHPSSLTFGIRRTCCHANETSASIANQSNSAQLADNP